MASTDDLKTHASSSTDFYALLAIDPSVTEVSQKALDRAWRKTALKYHPDKVGPNDAVAKDKFHLANIGYEVLRDPTLRALYDRARAARLQREQHRAKLDAGKRAAREDLETRERAAGAGFKRRAGEAFPGEEDEKRLEREIARLAEDGRRRREERAAQLRRDEAERAQRDAEEARNVHDAAAPTEPSGDAAPAAHVAASELDRTVRARFVRDATTAAVGAKDVEALFRAAFGAVELAFDRKDKKRKSEGTGSGSSTPDHATPNGSSTPRNGSAKSTLTLATTLVTFTSLLGAHAAVHKWRHHRDAAAQGDAGVAPLWLRFEEVSWAAGAEPAAVQAWAGPPGTSPTAPTPARDGTEGNGSAAHGANGNGTGHGHGTGAAAFSTPAPKLRPRNLEALKGTKKAFGFSPAAAGGRAATPTGSPFVGAAGGGPSLEELTLMRLRHAERRRLEVEALQKEEGDEA